MKRSLLATCHNVFQGVFQNVFQDVFQDTVREVFQAVFQELFQKVGWLKKIPKQKWLISYFWEHFLVPEHHIPIWLAFVLTFNVRNGLANMDCCD